MIRILTWFVLLPLEFTLQTGCVGILPVPPNSSEVPKGRKIEHSEVKFIVPGVTTRREVERRLGAGTRHCDRPPAAAYLWETPGWTVHWWAFGPYGGDSDEFPVGGRHAFFVAFDGRGIVRQADFVSLSQRGSLDDKLEEWAKRVQPAPTTGNP